MTREFKPAEAGFTLVELLVAMTIFSFMLLIVVSGFINIVKIHNQAVAANISEDNARTAMDELVRAVRTSNGVVQTGGTLCLTNTNNAEQTVYYLSGSGVLMRSSTCTPGAANVQAITSSVVVVTDFASSLGTVSSTRAFSKPQVNLSLTVASRTGTQGGGATVTCGPTDADRAFCSAITLKSGAVPR